MKKVSVLMSVLVGLLVMAGSCGQSPAPPGEQEGIRIEVSRNGFNGSSQFRIEVEEGEEVEITFVYGDTDFPQDNPHVIEFPELGIKTGTLNRLNQEETVRFTAGERGEIRFMCTNVECVGHPNLLNGIIMVK